jgi:hypothetical protein
MADADWADEGLRLLGCDLRLPGGPRLLLLFNAGDAAAFRLPDGTWRRRLDTAAAEVARDEAAEGEVTVGWQSVQAYLAERSPVPAPPGRHEAVVP